MDEKILSLCLPKNEPIGNFINIPDLNPTFKYSYTVVTEIVKFLGEANKKNAYGIGFWCSTWSADGVKQDAYMIGGSG
jgi:hypothetical protein